MKFQINSRFQDDYKKYFKGFHRDFMKISKTFYKNFIKISWRFHKDYKKISVDFKNCKKYGEIAKNSKILNTQNKNKNKNNKDPVRISSFTRDQKQ